VGKAYKCYTRLFYHVKALKLSTSSLAGCHNIIVYYIFGATSIVLLRPNVPKSLTAGASPHNAPQTHSRLEGDKSLPQTPPPRSAPRFWRLRCSTSIGAFNWRLDLFRKSSQLAMTESWQPIATCYRDYTIYSDYRPG
jgi:hypothetical protein